MVVKHGLLKRRRNAGYRYLETGSRCEHL